MRISFLCFGAAVLAAAAPCSSSAEGRFGSGEILWNSIPAMVRDGTAARLEPYPPNHDLRLTIHLVDFGANEATAVEAVTKWAQDNKLPIVEASSDERRVEIDASVTAAEKAFNVKIYSYQFGEMVFFANNAPPTVPGELKGIVASIEGLDSLL